MKSDTLSAEAGGGVAARTRVLAAVVTYNPGAYLAFHLAALRRQVDQVVVVDNGSADLDAVRRACEASGCRLVANPRNLGIATALNQAADEARSAQVEWLATFDQDSLLPDGAIEAMLALADSHPRRQRVGMVAMTHKDRGTGKAYHAASDVLDETATWRLLRSTITSGSMVRCDVLGDCGGFEDRLFIDFVDHEFCLRIRRRGWLVVEAVGVVMSHSLGASRVHRLLWRRIVLTHHSPLRRYYITRNALEVYRRNLLFDPLWAGKGLLLLATGSAALLLFEEERVAKLGAMVRGVFDVATRRFGPRS